MHTLITALFLASPIAAQVIREPVTDNGRSTCLTVLTDTPKNGYPQLNSGLFKVNSDLEMTTDRFQANQDSGITSTTKYILDWYNQNYMTMNSYTLWDATGVVVSEQDRNFIDKNVIVDKLAGLSLYTAIGSLDASSFNQHGFRLDQSSVAENQKITETTTVPINQKISKISFSYGVETLQGTSGPNYSQQNTFFDDKQFDFIYTNTQGTGLDLQEQKYYLYRQYYKVTQMEVNGIQTIGGTASFASTNQWPQTATYDLQANEQVLGFETYYQEFLESTFVGNRDLIRRFPIISWIGLVVLDTTCVQQRFCPSAPQLQINQQQSSCDQVYVQWNQFGQAASGQYVLEYGPSSQQSNLPYSVNVDASTGFYIVRNNLAQGNMSFRIRVASLTNNAVCSGSSSSGYAYYTVQTCLPLEPQNVRTFLQSSTCDASNANIVVSWNAPIGGAPVTSYSVQLSSSQYGLYQSPTRSCNNLGLNQLQCTIPYSELQAYPFSFTTGTSIWAKVTANNSKGSAPSLAANGAQVNAGPGPVQSFSQAGGSLPSSTQINLQWSPPAGNVGSIVYELRMREAAPTLSWFQSNPAPFVSFPSTITGTTFQVTSSNAPPSIGLRYGLTYEFQIYAKTLNPSCLSAGSQIVRVIFGEAPGAPTCVRTENLAVATDVKISWVAPTGAAATSITAYYVTVRGAGNTFYPITACNSQASVLSNRECTITTASLKQAPYYLNDGDQVVAQVVAQNSIGTSLVPGMSVATSSSSCSGLAIIKGCPSAPLQPRTTWNDDNDILTFSWQVPASDGGSPITGYTTRIYNQGDSAQSGYQDIPCAPVAAWTSSGTQSCTIPLVDLIDTPFNVEVGDTFCLRAVATNALCTGPESVDSSRVSNGQVFDQCEQWIKCPDKPINIAQDAALTSWYQMMLTWENGPSIGGSPIINYKIEMKKSVPSSDPWAPVDANIVITNKMYPISELITGQNYDFRIVACNARCCSAYSDTVTLLYDPAQPPKAPLNLVEVQAETCCDRMTITWDRPTDDGGADITGYLIQWYLASNRNTAYSVEINDVNLLNVDYTPTQLATLKVNQMDDLKFTIRSNTVPNGIIAGETYVVRVSARNQVATSYASEAVTIMAVCCPGAPTNLRGDQATSTNKKIGLVWQPAQSDCAPITDYRVFRNDRDAGSTVWNIEHSSLQTTSYVFQDATHCTNYGFGVKARNKKCWGAMSNLVDLVAADRPDRPNRPTCNYNEAAGSFQISWTQAATSQACAPVLDYNLQVRNNNGFQFNGVTCADNAATTCTITTQTMSQSPYQLRFGDSLVAKVAARNEYGVSIFSDESVACAYAITPPCARIDRAYGETQSTLTMSFIPGTYSSNNFGGQNIQTYYRVKQKNTSSNSWTTIYNQLPTGQGNTFVANNLVYGTSYSWMIESYNDAGTSTGCTVFTQVFQPKICPIAPTNLASGSQSICGQSSFTLNWVAPIQNNGPPVQSYTIWYKDAALDNFWQGQSWLSGAGSTPTGYAQLQTGITAPTTSATVSIPNVNTNGRYSFYVTATNRDCVSPASALFEYQFTAAPSPPQLSGSSQCSTGSISLSWNAGANSGSVSAYQLSYTTSSANSNFVPLNNYISSSQTSLVLRDLNGQLIASGQTYYFRIAATDARCPGTASNVVSVQVSGAAPTPSNLAMQVSGTQACLTWQAGVSSAGTSVTGYNAEVSYGAPAQFNFWGSTSNTNTFVPVTCNNQVNNNNFGNSNQCCFTLQNNQGGNTCQTIQTRVSASSSCGNSQYSNIASYSQSSIPQAPSNLLKDSTTTQTNAVGLRWSAPYDDGCSSIIGYQVSYKLNQCENYSSSGLTNSNLYNDYTTYTPVVQSSNLQNSNALYQLITTLSNGQSVQQGQSYSFIVRARNANGYGPYSNAITVLALSPPSAPLNPVVSTASNDMINVRWTRPTTAWNTVTGYKVHVLNQFGSTENVAKCLFVDALDLTCRLVLDDLRVSPFNLQTGNSFQLKVIAKSLQGDSVASQTTSPFSMPADTCPGGSGFVRTVLPSVDVDAAPPAGSDDQDNNQAPSDNSDDSDDSDDANINLKAKNIDAGFTSDSASQDQQSAGFGYGVFLGIAVTVGIVALLAGGYVAYTKAIARNAKNIDRSQAQAVEDEENTTHHNNSARRLSAGGRKISEMEEDFSHTIKNLNGNNPFGVSPIAESKIEREVQA